MRCQTIFTGLILYSCSVLVPVAAAPPNVNAGVGEGAAAAQSDDAAESAQQIRTWISELAASEYATRRQAFMNLWEQGSVALSEVRSAASNGDQQVAATARILELLLKLEISPKDNAELAELLQMSRASMHRSIMSLTEKGHWRLATELLRSNSSMLDAYRKTGRNEWLCMVVQSAHDQGDARKAWPIIQQLLSPEHSHWLAAKTQLPLEPNDDQQDVDAQALSLLFKGEFEQAWALTPSIELQQRIIFLSGRWEWLRSDALRTHIAGGDASSLEGRARQAAYAYLADDIERSDQLLAEVLDELKSVDSTQLDDIPPDETKNPFRRVLQQGTMSPKRQNLITSLLICGAGDAARELSPLDKQRQYLFYYSTRLEYDRALAAFGLTPDMADFDTWLETNLSAQASALSTAKGRSDLADFDLLCDFASLLVAMGKTSEGLRLFNGLFNIAAAAPELARDAAWSLLAPQGRQTQFRAHLVRLLDKRDGDLSPDGRKRFFNELYPEWIVIAPALWKTAPPELVQRPREVLTSGELPVDVVPAKTDARDAPGASVQQKDPQAADKSVTPGERAQINEERRWTLLERLWRFDRDLIAEHPAEPLVENWLKRALREASPTEDTTPSGTSRSMSQIALRMGLRPLALSFAKSSKGRSAIADVAEIYSHERSFENASLLWESAIRSDPWRHDWILENVNALSMIGEQEKAKSLEDSRWLRPLAIERTSAAYSTMAAKLHEDGLNEEAKEYARAAFSLLDPNHETLPHVARLYANVLQEQEDYTTAANVQRVRSILLLTQPSFDSELAVLQYAVSEEFLARALADLDAGNVEAALDCIERFQRVRPSGIEICEHAYPRLVKHGRQDAADELLKRCAQRMLAHLQKWPEDAASHNNLAWMLARCNQRLDEALEHAEQAVKLTIDAPTYLDTLAETHFRLGHLEQALQLAEKCAALDPRHVHYRKQLQRFREARRAQLQTSAASLTR